MRPQLHITRGLPASGKTTFAHQLVADTASRGRRMVRSNRDDLRLMLHQGRWSRGNEKLVTAVQHAMVTEALLANCDAVVDDTNLNPRVLRELHRIADTCRADVVVHDQFLEVPLRECIARDAKRDRSVGEDVIRRMWEQYLKPPPRQRTGQPTCVLVDVDGTLALMNGRSPFDWDRVGDDLPNEHVVDLVCWLANRHAIVVLSGRDGSCRDATEKWLRHHLRFTPDGLLMREAGDTRHDWEVKAELLTQVEQSWDPVLAIDDRQQVVDLWRERGIECWQVASGRF